MEVDVSEYEMCTVCGLAAMFVVVGNRDWADVYNGPYAVCDHHAQEILNGHDVTLEG